MSVLVILIGVSITIAAGFLVSYLWAIKSGQYDDKHTPAMRILFDDGKVIDKNDSEIDNSKNKSSKNGAG
ncbi:MAG: cbb3-type cytochrome oxidase assembly protein CcoS [Rhodothermaceae bacterium]